MSPFHAIYSLVRVQMGTIPLPRRTSSSTMFICMRFMAKLIIYALARLPPKAQWFET